MDGRHSGEHRHLSISAEHRGHHHGGLGGSLHWNHVAELQPFMRLPPPHLYTCTVGRNRSGARQVFSLNCV